jgi:hypothetical protein
MLKHAALAALVAGLYGIAHDEVTFSISSEYFTQFKFHQFSWADLGLPPRLHVAEIGFLASWWVGFLAVWFWARVAVPALSAVQARKVLIQGVAILVAGTLLGGVTGYIVGLIHDRNHSDWGAEESFLGMNAVVDVRSFVRVAYIHNGSYLGALAGFVAALVNVRRRNLAPAEDLA